MAVQTYSQVLDTMVSTALDTYTRDPINALNASGEKFLTAAAQQGRIFVVNDAENVRHPMLYDHGENTSYYSPDNTSGTQSVTLTHLQAEATEILTHSIWTLQAATRNINMPQSQPPGNIIDYVSNVVKANMMSILNQEEVHFTTGQLASTEGEPVEYGSCTLDEDFAAARPVNLPAIQFASTAYPLISGSTGVAEQFGGVSTADIAQWSPYQKMAGDTDIAVATDAQLFSALQSSILESTYSETERPTHVYTSIEVFERILELMR